MVGDFINVNFGPKLCPSFTFYASWDIYIYLKITFDQIYLYVFSNLPCHRQIQMMWVRTKWHHEGKKMPWLCTMFLIYFKDVHVKWCWYQRQAYTWWRHMKQWSAWFWRRGFSVLSPAHCRHGHKTVHAVFMHSAIDLTGMQEKGEKPIRSLAVSVVE